MQMYMYDLKTRYKRRYTINKYVYLLCSLLISWSCMWNFKFIIMCECIVEKTKMGKIAPTRLYQIDSKFLKIKVITFHKITYF